MTSLPELRAACQTTIDHPWAHQMPTEVERAKWTLRELEALESALQAAQERHVADAEELVASGLVMHQGSRTHRRSPNRERTAKGPGADPMSVDHPDFGTFCCICFTGLTDVTCATDTNGTRWDVCTGECARRAGIVEPTS